MAGQYPFVAEICIFPFNFPPTGWAFCDGQLLPISQSTALFSLLGTTYGGDGKSTFALPDFRGRAPMHPGQGSGLSDRYLGESEGEASVTLLVSEMPNHTHPVKNLNYPVATAGETTKPTKSFFAAVPDVNLYSTTVAAVQSRTLRLADAPQGGNLPHNNMQPFLTLNFCIALQGVFPQRP